MNIKDLTIEEKILALTPENREKFFAWLDENMHCVFNAQEPPQENV